VRGADGLHKEQRAVDDLLPAPDAAHLHRVVRLSRDGSPTPWLEPVDLLPALAALAEETSYLRLMERPLHRLADTLTATGGLQVLHYADGAGLADVVHALLGGE